MKQTFWKIALGVQAVLLCGFIGVGLHKLPLKWQWQTVVNIPVTQNGGKGYLLEVPSFINIGMNALREPNKSYIEKGLGFVSERYAINAGKDKELRYEILTQKNDLFVYTLEADSTHEEWTVCVSLPSGGAAEIAVVKAGELAP